MDNCIEHNRRNMGVGRLGFEEVPSSCGLLAVKVNKK
jgi:hypothetical protein